MGTIRDKVGKRCPDISECLPVGIVVVGTHLGNRRRGESRPYKRISRLVVLPDYQGIGIGGRLLDQVAGLVAGEGSRVSISTSHPGVISHLARSETWRVRNVTGIMTKRRSTARAVASGLRKTAALHDGVGRAMVSAVWDV